MGLGSGGQCKEEFKSQECPKPYVQGLYVDMPHAELEL